ncbi:hypothetical protein P8452_14497 [Trifolium repens]|nr:hypothetical protein P8452_14497 [Trifolium repens]
MENQFPATLHFSTDKSVYLVWNLFMNSVLAVSMGEKAFGDQFSENLHAEHLNEVLNHEWLSASVINVYARYLYDKFISLGGLTTKLCFLSPHESHDDLDGNKSIARILLINNK